MGKTTFFGRWTSVLFAIFALTAGAAAAAAAWNWQTEGRRRHFNSSLLIGFTDLPR